MTSRFSVLLLGLVFAFLRISIGTFDIMPDVVGYVMISLACAGLGQVSRQFTVVQVFCLVLAVLSVLPGWFIRERVPGQEHLAEAMQCGMMWFLMGGVMALAAANQRQDLARRAAALRWMGLGLSAFQLVSVWELPAGGNRFPGTLVVAAGIGDIIVLILALLVIRRVRREIAPHVQNDRDASWWPPVLGLSSGLAAMAVGFFFFQSGAGYESTTFSGANFHAMTPQGCEAVHDDLMKLLDAKGFSSTYNPTEMDRFAGLHSADQVDTWLTSGRDELKGIALRISKAPKSISINTKWEHHGFKRDATLVKRRAYEVSLDIARWFQTRPENADLRAEREDAGIIYFEKSLAELPAD